MQQNVYNEGLKYGIMAIAESSYISTKELTSRSVNRHTGNKCIENKDEKKMYEENGTKTIYSIRMAEFLLYLLHLCNKTNIGERRVIVLSNVCFCKRCNLWPCNKAPYNVIIR